MKKVFLLMMVAMATMTVTAQGSWQKHSRAADELKGIEGGDVYIYTDSMVGSFIFLGWDIPQFRITSDKEMFSVMVSAGYTGQLVLVGIYDDSGKMTDSFKMWLDLEENTGLRFMRTRNAGMGNPSGQKNKVKKIFKTLQSGSGYVRMVTPRYNTTDFDLKILPYKE